MKIEYSHKYAYKEPGKDSTLTVLHNEESATNVVRAYYYFLLGVSFTGTAVLDAFENILEEHRSHVKDDSHDE